MRQFLFEATWYSPHSYEVYHYAIIDVDAVDFHQAVEKAYEVLRRQGRPLKMGEEPVTLRLVGPTHHWGNGYKPGREAILRENPLSLHGKEAVLGFGLLLGVIGVAVLLRGKTAAASTPPTVTPTTPPASVAPRIVPVTASGSVNLHVGDAVLVELPLLSADNYFQTIADPPGILTADTQIAVGTQVTQGWTATAKGTATLTYQQIAQGGPGYIATGSPIVIVVNVA